MSTLILGITLDDLGAAVILLPLGGALIHLLISTWQTTTERTWLQPLVKTLGIGIPLLTLVLLILIQSMMNEMAAGQVLGPYAVWFRAQGVIFDIALWLDPLVLLWSFFVLALALLVACYRLFYADPASDLAPALAKQELFLFFVLLLLWTDNLPLFYLAWEGLALTAYWLWQKDDRHGSGRIIMFWITRFVNGLFLISLVYLVEVLTIHAESDSAIRLTFALLEEKRHLLNPVLLYAWIIPALAYAAQWPASFWWMRTRSMSSSNLCWLYGFGLSGGGLYLLTRLNVLILNQASAWYWLELIGALTALIAAATALRQPTLRGILAAVILSHYGIIICAFGGGNFSLALMQWYFVAIAASILALAAGLIGRRIGSDEIGQLGGLIKAMPVVAVCSLLACLTLAALPPLSVFASQYQLLWRLTTEARQGAFIATMISSLFVIVAISRWWAATFLGKVPTADSGKLTTHETRFSGVILLFPVIFLLGVSWFALPKPFYGSETLQNWLLPVFEDHLPIRSERFSAAAQRNFAALCGIFGYLIAVCVVWIYASHRNWLSRQGDYWVWWDRLKRNIHRIMSNCGGSLQKGASFILQNILHDGLERKLFDGLILAGVSSGAELLGRGLARIQSGYLGHYLIYFVLGVMLLVTLFTI